MTRVKMEPQPPSDFCYGDVDVITASTGRWVIVRGVTHPEGFAVWPDGNKGDKRPDAPHKPGDVVKLPEEWRCTTNALGGDVIEYRDGMQFEYCHPGCCINEYPELDELGDDWQLAETMPAWAIRERVVTTITPELAAGVWWWRVESKPLTGE